jgi:hypothetical protein
MGWMTKESWFDSWQGQEFFKFFFPRACRKVLAPTQSAVQWVMGIFALGVKQRWA